LTSDLKQVPQERILLAETRETRRQVTDKISHIQESQDSGGDLWEQVLENLEGLSERLTEICNELQTAAQEKIDFSKTKLNEMRSEVRAMLQEINTASIPAAA
jgi:archaellum component FlaC